MPQRLGRYVVRRRIGNGAFATVWLAYDEQLDSPVAVKVLADNWTEDAHILRRFQEEGRYLRKVESPHVVTVYDAGNGKTGVERTVTILGRDITLKATGTVTADGGQLLIEPETVDLGGPSFLDSAASGIARNLATIRQDVPGVPAGMSLTGIEVTPQGFDARLNGNDVVIGR